MDRGCLCADEWESLRTSVRATACPSGVEMQAFTAAATCWVEGAAAEVQAAVNGEDALYHARDTKGPNRLSYSMATWLCDRR